MPFKFILKIIPSLVSWVSLGLGILNPIMSWGNSTCSHTQYIGYFLSQDQTSDSLTSFLKAEIKSKSLPSPFAGIPSATKEKFRTVLKYFDLKTIALLQRGIAIQEIPNLDYVFNETDKLEQRRQQITLDKITSTSTFLDAASELIGRPIKIRDFDVVMSSESDLEGDLAITVDTASEQQISKNPFLRIYSKKLVKGTIRIGVEYASLQGLKKIAKNYPHLFSKDLTKEILMVKLDRNGQVLVAKDSLILKRALRALLDHLISGNIGFSDPKMSQEQKNFLLYQSFMALHPFEDGNGRSGRLFYELISQRTNSSSKFLSIPIFDLDLLGGQSVLEMKILSIYLNDWISNAKSEKEFLDRSSISLEALANLWPNLKILFPEISKTFSKNKSKTKTAKIFKTKKDLKILNSSLHEHQE